MMMGRRVINRENKKIYQIIFKKIKVIGNRIEDNNNFNTKGDKIQGFRLQVTRGHYQPFSTITSDKYKLSDVILRAKSTTQYTKHSNYSSIVP